MITDQHKRSTFEVFFVPCLHQIYLCVCVNVRVLTGLTAEHSSGGLGRPCSPSAARDHSLFHQADLPETRQGETLA